MEDYNKDKNIESPRSGTTKQLVGKLLLGRALWYAIPLIVILIILLWTFHWSEKNFFNKNVDTEYVPDAAQIEKVRQLYSREGVPERQGENDLYNYGLNTEQTSTSSLGVLAFTGRNKNILSQMSIYFLDFDTQEVYVPDFLLRNNLFVFGGFNDVQTPTGLFLDTISSASSQSARSQLGVHYYDVEKDEFGYVNSADGVTEARSLKWSEESNLLAFTRLKEPTNSFIDGTDIAAWEVVLVNPEASSSASQIIIDEATGARWSPDGDKLVFLRSDGLYLHDVELALEQKIRGLEGEDLAFSSTMIDVSPDGRYLAWTTTQHGMIAMYEITDWNDFSMQEIGRITVPDTHIMWPQFSPDGQHYAVQAIDAPKEGTIERENPRFEVRPTLGREVILSYPTNDFIFTEFHTDGWIAYDPAVDLSE